MDGRASEIRREGVDLLLAEAVVIVDSVLPASRLFTHTEDLKRVRERAREVAAAIRAR